MIVEHAPALADEVMRRTKPFSVAYAEARAIRDDDDERADGRNRLAACNLAGVQPTVTTLEDGVDPVGFILSENAQRRHMSKGALAMSIAMALTTEAGKRSGARAALGALTFAPKVSEARLSQAVTVLKYAPDLAILVRDGAEFLDKAYAKARERKEAQDSQAQQDARALAEVTAKTERLRAGAPDLAGLVDESRLTLAPADRRWFAAIAGGSPPR